METWTMAQVIYGNVQNVNKFILFMPKCSNCRKADALDSRWDKARMFFFRFFHGDIADLSQDKYTQGFADGYVKGREHQHESDQKAAKQLWGVEI